MRRLRVSLCAFVLSLVLGCSPAKPSGDLMFAPAQLPAAQVGVLYTATFTVTLNGTTIYNISSIAVAPDRLPPGLTLAHEPNDSFASVVGTPTLAGTYRFTVSASCFGTNSPGRTGEKEYVIDVSAANR